MSPFPSATPALPPKPVSINASSNTTRPEAANKPCSPASTGLGGLNPRMCMTAMASPPTAAMANKINESWIIPGSGLEASLTEP
jgi:hypothetical protein